VVSPGVCSFEHSTDMLLVSATAASALVPPSSRSLAQLMAPPAGGINGTAATSAYTRGTEAWVTGTAAQEDLVAGSSVGATGVSSTVATARGPIAVDVAAISAGHGVIQQRVTLPSLRISSTHPPFTAALPPDGSGAGPSEAASSVYETVSASVAPVGQRWASAAGHPINAPALHFLVVDDGESLRCGRLLRG
jgi:hypothetical protein